ncbi:high mobility group B protein 7 [Cornus florida]|uniref:high mobility group B protein 7 n=1 Tax=Cornus florida TaxID=4283 RepID=UPI00289ACC44|nr:high mobility group B protein 7 [Cornus florida]
MAGGGGATNPPRPRKRVEVETSSTSLKRARDGSAFARCDECNKDVPVVLIGMHNCSLDAKIKMNLESQVVEKVTEVKKKPAEKSKAISTGSKPTTEKKGKKAKDPNKPKRPPTAFFVFMEEFRKTFKEANPDCKKVSTVAKEGGEKWKSLTVEEKKVYQDRAAELKAEYEKVLESHNDAGNEDEEGASSEKEAEPEAEAEAEVETISDDE